MVFRHIGEISVRTDDLDDRERKLVQASIRLITDINLRDGTQFVAWFVSTFLMLIATVIFWLAMRSSDQLPTEVEVRSMFGAAAAEIVIGYVISLPFSGTAEQRTRSDAQSLNLNMRESNRCRELVRAYREAHPSFQKIMDRVADATQPKTA